MSSLHHLSALTRRGVLPRRTVRLRLTALYGALFLASGAGLLAITNILARSWPWPALLIETPVGSGPARPPQPGSPHPSWPSCKQRRRSSMRPR